MTGRLPDHLQIVRWEDPVAENATPRRKTFNAIITDKAVFYECCSAAWDKASPSSYQYTEDLRIIENWGLRHAILKREGLTILDYGPGSTGKVAPLTRRLLRGSHYVAVDMDRPFLDETIGRVVASNPNITVAGIQTSFDNFPEIVGLIQGPKLIVSLGSNLLNHPDPRQQMRPIVEKMSPGDMIYLSIDCHDMEDEKKVEESYKCPDFMEFINGTLELIEGYKAEQWEMSSGLRMEPTPRYSFTLTAKENVKIRDELYPRDSSIEFFPCYKSNPPAVKALAAELGLTVLGSSSLTNSKMFHFLLEKN